MQKITNLFRNFSKKLVEFIKDYLILLEIIFIPAIAIILPATIQTQVYNIELLYSLKFNNSFILSGSMLWICFNWFVYNNIK